MPYILMLPEVGSSSEVNILKVVDFPAPFTPRRAKHSPFERPKDKFSTARRGWPGLQGPEPRKYTLFKFFTFISNSLSGVSFMRDASCYTSLSIKVSDYFLTIGSLYLLIWIQSPFIFLPNPISIEKSNKVQNTKLQVRAKLSPKIFSKSHAFTVNLYPWPEGPYLNSTNCVCSPS